MNKYKWYYYRLKAMSAAEIIWRLQQSLIFRAERKKYFKCKIRIDSSLHNKKFKKLKFNPNFIGINYTNKNYTLNDKLYLQGGYDYEKFKTDWYSGFQTDKFWPNEFSYDIDLSEPYRIGDPRTNWQLNRHAQFVMWAKNFYITGDKAWYDRLCDEYEDWNEKNPFLYGINWTSILEIGIRTLNWMLTMCFLYRCKSDNNHIIDKMRIGVINMADYITKHHSRYSSANNHLINEILGVVMAGYAFNYSPWKVYGLKILNDQLSKQVYSDGVNKEESLFYQSFFMEGYGLTMKAILSNREQIPEEWIVFFKKMSEYICSCYWNEKRICEFGDSDNSCVIDINGNERYHYDYILQLFSLLLGIRYHSFYHISETTSWLFTEKEISDIIKLPIYDNSKSRTFIEGGNSILRSNDGKILIGIDHAPLGYGTIAAHAHADALSFQMIINGNTLFADPGTYLYQAASTERNDFRSTQNHNTVCINGKNQSEILGPFLWGRKAKTKLVKYDLTKNKDVIIAETDGYKPIIHRRTFNFDKEKKIIINDRLLMVADAVATFLVGIGNEVSPNGKLSFKITNNDYVCNISFSSNDDISANIEQAEISHEYGIKENTVSIKVKGFFKSLITTIVIDY